MSPYRSPANREPARRVVDWNRVASITGPLVPVACSVSLIVTYGFGATSIGALAPVGVAALAWAAHCYATARRSGGAS